MPGSFGIFETFRILIPGYLAALYCAWYLTLFWPKATSYFVASGLGTATFLGVGLLAGLLLYLQKVPLDPPEIEKLLPSKAILRRASDLGVTVRQGDETDLYFYLLNNYFSDSMRERVFYYGNIYRAAQKTWLISISFACLTLVTAAIGCLFTHSLQNAWSKVVYILLLAIVFLLAQRSAGNRYKEILYGQRKWLEMRQPLVDKLLRDGHDAHAALNKS